MFTLLNPARKGRAGFTLIELLVVVLILGILLAVAIPLYLSSVKNANVKTVKANMKSIATAAQAYRVRNGTYPTDVNAMVGANSDLAAVPNDNPPGVTYSFSGSNTTVTATTSDTSLFPSGATTATYNLSTGQWAPQSDFGR